MGEGGTGELRRASWRGTSDRALEDAGIPRWVPLNHCCGPTKHLPQLPKNRREVGKGREKGKEEELGEAGRGWAEGEGEGERGRVPIPSGSHPELEAPWAPSPPPPPRKRGAGCMTGGGETQSRSSSREAILQFLIKTPEKG